MKNKNKFPSMLAIGLILVSMASCQKSEAPQAVSPDATTATTQPRAVGPWTRLFTDDFNNTSSFNNWTRTNRSDYNSSICHYVSTDPTIGTFDSRNVLVLTASKTGSFYTSGHVKSNISFKPAVNEEYRVSASIKLIAMNGSTYMGFGQTYGAWPAFWTVQETNWPINGEIDIMEGYSFSNSTRFASNLFYGTSTGNNLLGNTCTTEYPNTEGWHMYDEYWQNVNGAVTVTIKLDGNTVATYTNAKNGNLHLENFGPHNIILNLNVGSDGGIFNNSLINLYTKTMMWVDYVTLDKRTL